MGVLEQMTLVILSAVILVRLDASEQSTLAMSFVETPAA
jgi:hypothetical protein